MKTLLCTLAVLAGITLFVVPPPAHADKLCCCYRFDSQGHWWLYNCGTCPAICGYESVTREKIDAAVRDVTLGSELYAKTANNCESVAIPRRDDPKQEGLLKKAAKAQ